MDNIVSCSFKKVLFKMNIKKEDIISINKLGGLTNNNYKLTLSNDKLVIRIPGENTKQFIDRVNEKNNSNIAEILGLDSKCVYFNEITGVKICRFIDGAETLNKETAKYNDNIKLIVENLKTLHESDEKFYTTFNPFDTIDIYEKALRDSNGVIYKNYYSMKNIFITFKEILKNMNINYVPCHIDPLPENFVKSNKKKLYLIDWEYSGNYDPLWDLAAVMLECDFSNEQENMLLLNYLGRNANFEEILRIHIHKIMQDVFWALWSATKVAKGEDEMKEFSVKKYESAEKNMTKYLDLSIGNINYGII